MLVKIGYEFDFVREANAMEKIRHFLYENNKKPPVLVPRVVRPLVTRFVTSHLSFLQSEFEMQTRMTNIDLFDCLSLYMTGFH